MARRRKKDDSFDDLCGFFFRVPAWICVPLALVAFGMIQAVALVVSASPMLKPLAPLVEIFAVIVPFGILIAGLRAAINKARRRQLYDTQVNIESVRALSWREFEMLVGEAYRRQGYAVTETGGGGADGGIDLVLCRSKERTLVQCKQWRVYKVGVGPVRELFGVLMAEGADRAIFVTSGVYTQEARNFASGKPVILIDGEQLCQLIAPAYTVRNGQPAQGIGVETETENPGTCPLCGSPMLLRTAKRGHASGSRFWECSAYPKCKGTRSHFQ